MCWRSLSKWTFTRFSPGLLAMALFTGVAFCGLAGNARGDDLSNVLGVTHIDGKYYFGTEDYLDQGADQVLASGSKVIKVEMDSQTPGKYPWNAKWPVPTSLTDLARTAYFKSLFSKPFNTYVMTT